MKISKYVVAHYAALALALSASQAHGAAVTLTTPGVEYNGGLYTLGFAFTPNTAVRVTSLGVYDSGQDGLLNTGAQVGLWDNVGNLLVSVVVATGNAAALEGYFRYADISGYDLVAGTEYVIGAYTRDRASSLGNGQGGTGSFDPIFSGIQDRYSNFNSAFSYANISDGRAGAWLGGNFRWETASVPEPGSLALIGLGLAGLIYSRRKSVSRRGAA